ncbi:hypothetical protein Gotur_020317 [Gossypium turneri]
MRKMQLLSKLIPMKSINLRKICRLEGCLLYSSSVLIQTKRQSGLKALFRYK